MFNFSQLYIAAADNGEIVPIVIFHRQDATSEK